MGGKMNTKRMGKNFVFFGLETRQKINSTTLRKKDFTHLHYHHHDHVFHDVLFVAFDSKHFDDEAIQP